MQETWTSDRELPGLSADAEGVTDTARTSKSAVAAAALLVLGLLAPIEPRLAFFAAAAAVVALASLVLARRADFTRSSQTLAAGVLLLGTMLTIWTGVVTYVERTRLETRAVEVASDYMQVLAEGQMLPAIQMVGLPPVVNREDREASMSQKAVRLYLDDYAINKVRDRGTAAQWEPEGVVERTRDGDVQTYTVRFYDRAMTNPRPFDVELDYIPPNKYAVDKRYRWIVGGVNLPSH